MMPNTISVIIPAYEEHAIVEQTLANVYSVLWPNTQVILVDQSRGEQTKRIVESSFPDVIYLVSTRANRPANMNQWAEIATGDILLFHHADSRLPLEAKELLEFLDISTYIYGWFIRRFEPNLFVLKQLEWFFNYFTIQTHYLLWDNNIFIEKNAFKEIGWFREKPLYEDVNIVEKLKKYSKKMHKKWKVFRSFVVTSSRKFKKTGVLKWLTIVSLCLLMYYTGCSIRQIHRVYYWRWPT